MKYYLSIVDEMGDLVVRGMSEGKGDPVYEFGPVYEGGGPLLALLDDYYDQGLYGTGGIGQVRDLFFAMQSVVKQFDGWELETPAETSRKIREEAETDQALLPDNAVR